MICRLETLRLRYVAMRLVIIVSLLTFPFEPTPLICLAVNLKCSVTLDWNLYRDDGLANGVQFHVHQNRHLEIKRMLAAQCD
jgi:hypothetical protein